MQFSLLRTQVLALFLDCCRHRAIQPLTAAAKAGLPQSGLQDLLTKLAATVQVHSFINLLIFLVVGPTITT